MQLFISTLRTAISTDQEVAGSTDEGVMRQAIDAQWSTFTELQEVLERPMLEYAALTSFLVRSLGRNPLQARITQCNKVLREVWDRALSFRASTALWYSQTVFRCVHVEDPNMTVIAFLGIPWERSAWLVS